MSNKMTKDDASRIQSSNDKTGNDPGFAQRAQSAGDKHQHQASQGQSGVQGGGQQSGQGKTPNETWGPNRTGNQ